ncbi:hypothetical protein CRE_16150 [Caenorhabditis remanei]|uniref:Uncharacterized protein n=1 Tax=Caenorhabditis remanei TaxID=31234 RepID=E3MSI9_CAERE|nr:hypothetical protein CRE_16150 [Caenorhabditis remanei]
MILNSTHLFITDKLTTRTDALLMYLRRPGDVMFHRIPIAQDHVEKICIRDGTPRHIFKKHWKDFQHATGGAKDWNMIEKNVSSYLKEMILSSTQLLFTDELVTREDGLLLYVRQPRDKMYHRIALAQDEAEEHVYNVSTAYKLWINEGVQFAGKWKHFESQ